MTTPAISKTLVTFQIMDETGHKTEDNIPLDTAIDRIVEHAVVHARFVYIEGKVFLFSSPTEATPEDLERLRSSLEEFANPEVTLSGTLVGGLK